MADIKDLADEIRDMMEGHPVLPNEKNKLIEALKQELILLRQKKREGKIGEGLIESANRQEKVLQDMITKFFEKRGVITPQESASAFLEIDNSKKIRLQEKFAEAKRKLIAGAAVIVLIAVGWHIWKKRNK